MKIHNLHIVEGTRLAERWRRGEVEALDEHQYAELLMDFLRRLPSHWPIMRLLSETPRPLLLAPDWWLGKGQFIDYLCRRMQARGWRQGDLVEGGSDAARGAPAQATAGETGPAPLPGAAVAALFRAAGVRRRLGAGGLVALCVGRGGIAAGVQLFAAAAATRSRGTRIVCVGAEPGLLESLAPGLPGGDRGATELRRTGCLSRGRCELRLMRGDPRRAVFRLRGCADVIVHGAAPVERFAHLYSQEFLGRLATKLARTGVLVSPVDAAPLRHALLRIGLQVGACAGPGDRHRGTLAAWDAAFVTQPLSRRERRIADATLSGVPYRDASLTASRKEIARHRDRVLARLRRRGWRKRLPRSARPASGRPEAGVGEGRERHR